jgi:alpha-L-fucosidase
VSTDTQDLSARKTPAWFDEAKFGILVTWSAGAIPGYAPLTRVESLHGNMELLCRLVPHGEMYQLPLNIPESPTARHHAEHYGTMPYDRFVEQFRDEVIPRVDVEAWTDVIALSGARYATLLTKPEDGFLLWPSAWPNPRKTDWQAERDLVGEFADAVRDRGMRFGAYYCGGVDWTFKGLPGTCRLSECFVAPDDEQYVALADAHWRELIERYEPSVLWNDYSPGPSTDVAGLFHYYWERVPDGVVNNRWDGGPFEPSAIYHDFLTPEYSTEGSPAAKWEACRGMGLSFGFNREETEDTYNSATDLIHLLVDIVSRGGNLLLSLSPSGNGEVPWLQAERFLAIGQWLRVNGGAIYGTRPWERHAGVSGEGLGVRYTASDDAVHAVVLGTPERREVDIDVRLADGATVSLEGRRGELQWRSLPNGIRVELPERPFEQPAMALRIAPATAVRPVES